MRARTSWSRRSSRRRLQAEDILHNIRSGVVTVDVQGELLYANPMAEHLLGIDLVGHFGEPMLDMIGARRPELADRGASRRGVEDPNDARRGHRLDRAETLSRSA